MKLRDVNLQNPVGNLQLLTTTAKTDVVSAINEVKAGSGGGGGTPGGSTKQIQYNNSGAFAGNTNLIFDSSTNSTYFGNPPAYVAPSGNIWFFGDSITTGAYVNVGQSYTTLVAAALGLTENTFGVSGATLEKQTPLNPTGGTNMIDRISTIPTKGSSDKYIVFLFGINDWQYGGTNYNPTNFITDYTTIINATIAKGWSANQIYITSLPNNLQSFYNTVGSGGGTLTQASKTAFNTACQTIATNTGVNLVEIDNYVTNRGGDINQANTVHPNALGHALISKAIVAAIRTNISASGQSIAVNGLSEFYSIRFNTNNVLTNLNSNPLGVDSSGNIGILNATPYQFTLNYPVLKGGLQQAGAAIPTTLGTNDIVIAQDALLSSGYTAGAGANWNSIKLTDGSAHMSFITNFSNGLFKFINVNGTTAAFVVDRDGSIATKSNATSVGNTGHTAGDLTVPTGAGITSTIAGSYGTFQPQDASGHTYVRNSYTTGKIRVYTSGGTLNAQVECANFTPNGRLILQSAGTFTDDGVNQLQVTGSIAATGGFNASDVTASTTFNPLVNLTNTTTSTGSTDLFSPSIRLRTQFFNTTDKTSDFFITNEGNSSTTVAQLLISYSLAGAASSNLLSIDRFGNFNVQPSGAVFKVTNGNLNLATAGNKLLIATGTNASLGVSTLVAGTVTVATTAVTANSLIYVCYNTPAGTLAAGLAAPDAGRTAGTSFVINSLSTAGAVNTLDTSTVRWWIIN